MMGAVMGQKVKVLLVGGMEYNVPPEISRYFDVVRHITQGGKFQTLPAADYVFVVTEWAGHNLVESVKAKTDAPVIPLVRGGWEAIKLDLRRRSILPPEEAQTSSAAAEPKEAAVNSESLLSSMTESEIWKKYGSGMIEAAQVTLKPKEILSEDNILEALSLSGVPKEDCRAFLPKLQMKGILDPVSDGKWRLMAAPGIDFDNDRVKVDGELAPVPVPAPGPKGKGAKLKETQTPEEIKKGRGTNGSWGTDPKTGRRQVRSPELLSMMAGLPKGPYASKRALFHEIRKYSSFDALSDWQVEKYIVRAIEAKIVDDTHTQIYVNHDPNIMLSRAKMTAPEAEPEAPEKLMAAAITNPIDLAMQQYKDTLSKKIEKTDAEKAWCYVVEGMKKERERLGNVLAHCRIEWMGDNKVLVIFIPAALAQWQKFVESTENWGLVTKAVQERLAKDTAIRFMVDNGHRG